MSRIMVAAALLALALAACNDASTDEPALPEATGTPDASSAAPAAAPEDVRTDATSTPEPAVADKSECGADKLGRWLNALPTDDVKEEIASTVGERTIRYYTQGDPITMDFSPARLNVELGEDGRIKLFRCG